jgi:glutaconate CoA-transferase subunit B
MSLEPRRFVEKVSFLTSPGYIDGPAPAALRISLQGPNMNSTLGVFDFDTADGAGGSCEMRLLKLYPGVEQSTIEAMIPWPLVVANSVEVCSPPSPDELALLRNLDPRKQYLRGGRY